MWNQPDRGRNYTKVAAITPKISTETETQPSVELSQLHFCLFSKLTKKKPPMNHNTLLTSQLQPSFQSSEISQKSTPRSWPTASGSRRKDHRRLTVVITSIWTVAVRITGIWIVTIDHGRSGHGVRHRCGSNRRGMHGGIISLSG